MPPELLALFAKSFLLIAVLAVGVLAGMTAEQSLSRIRRQAWGKRNRWHWQTNRRGESVAVRPWLSTHHQVPSQQPDAADQLRTVMSADFTSRPILNKGEARVFKALDQVVIGCNPAWQVMAQVSLGEVLRCKDAEAYRCINSKRVDLLLIDGECRPRHAIEYQGRAHHQGTAAARDAVKKEALRRAGIGYHEVVAGLTTPAELKRLVERLVDTPRDPEVALSSARSSEPVPAADPASRSPGTDSGRGISDLRLL